MGGAVKSWLPDRPLFSGSFAGISPRAMAPAGSGREEDCSPGIGLSASGRRRDSFHILTGWKWPSRVQPVRSTVPVRKSTAEGHLGNKNAKTRKGENAN